MVYKTKTGYYCTINDVINNNHVMYVLECDSQNIYSKSYYKDQSFLHDVSYTETQNDFNNIEITEKTAKKLIMLWGHSLD